MLAISNAFAAVAPRLPRRYDGRRPDPRLQPEPAPDRQRRRGRPEPVRGLSAYRAGQHGDRAVGAHGHGPGRLYRPRHAGGRGAGCRLVADARRGCRRQPQVLRQPDVGRGRAGHRRLDRDPELLGPLPPGGSRRPGDAGRRRPPRPGPCPCRRDAGRERRRLRIRSGRQATFGELAAAAAQLSAAGAAGAEAAGRSGG